MKWSLMLTDKSVQFNLEAESESEKELCQLLNRYNGGKVKIHQGVDVGPSNGGYLRAYDTSNKACAITIGPPDPVTIGPQ